MKNLKQIIALLFISILLIGALVSCKDEIKLSPEEQAKINEAFKEKVLTRIKEDANANLNDLSLDGVTSLEGLFKDQNFNGDISKWDVSKVTNFKSMFEGSTFNGNISKWDISSAENMQFMFKNNTAFDQDLSAWDINENKTLFASIFKGATNMLGPIDQSRNSPKATDKMPSVIKARYDKMVKPVINSATQNIKSLMKAEIAKNGNNGNYNYIDTSDTTSFEHLFTGKSEFNGKINDWDTSKVVEMVNMFEGASAFNQPINDWDTSKARKMYDMFNKATAFNQPLNKWDVSNVTDMDRMFSEAVAFNQPIGNWNTSKVTVMVAMFSKATAFNQPLNKWDVSKVNDMRFMFSGAEAFNQDLTDWNDKLNATLIQNLDNYYKENIFKNSAMEDKNKPDKLR